MSAASRTEARVDADADFLDENNDGFVDTQVITNAPEWTGAIRANVDFPVFGGLLTGSLGYSYRDDSMLTNEGVDPIIQPAYGRVDAWIAWLSGASRRIGPARTGMARLLLNEPLPYPLPADQHMLDRFHALVAPLGAFSPDRKSVV